MASCAHSLYHAPTTPLTLTLHHTPDGAPGLMRCTQQYNTKTPSFSIYTDCVCVGDRQSDRKSDLTHTVTHLAVPVARQTWCAAPAIGVIMSGAISPVYMCAFMFTCYDPTDESYGTYMYVYLTEYLTENMCTDSDSTELCVWTVEAGSKLKKEKNPFFRYRF